MLVFDHKGWNVNSSRPFDVTLQIVVSILIKQKSKKKRKWKLLLNSFEYHLAINKYFNEIIFFVFLIPIQDQSVSRILFLICGCFAKHWPMQLCYKHPIHQSPQDNQPLLCDILRMKRMKRNIKFKCAIVHWCACDNK